VSTGVFAENFYVQDRHADSGCGLHCGKEIPATGLHRKYLTKLYGYSVCNKTTIPGRKRTQFGLLCHTLHISGHENVSLLIEITKCIIRILSFPSRKSVV
jgi:hypothetical protein